MKNISFVELKINDFDKLQEYMNRLCKYEIEIIGNIFLQEDWVFTEKWKKGIKKLLENKNIFVCLMKDWEEEIWYFIGKDNKSEFYETPWNFCELDNFYINKEYRWKWYWRILMQKFFDWWKEKWIKKFLISSVTVGNTAELFYKKMGYKPYSQSFYIQD